MANAAAMRSISHTESDTLSLSIYNALSTAAAPAIFTMARRR